MRARRQGNLMPQTNTDLWGFFRVRITQFFPVFFSWWFCGWFWVLYHSQQA